MLAKVTEDLHVHVHDTSVTAKLLFSPLQLSKPSP